MSVNGEARSSLKCHNGDICLFSTSITVNGQAQSSLNSQNGGISEEDQILLMCLDGDKIKRKLVMRKTKSSVALHCLPLTQYVSRRISDMGWDWRDADPLTLKQKVTLRGIAPPKGSKQTSEKGEDEEIEERKRKVREVAATVAILTSNVMVFTYLEQLRGVLSKKAFRIVEGSAFRCIASAVFSIFDTEDFERIHDFGMYLNEYAAFSSGLDYKKSVTEQAVEPYKYSILTENDIFCALKNLHDFKEDARPKEGLFCYGIDFRVTASSDSDIETAERVIQSCAPLKRDERMQLILEMMFKKQYLVYDTIVLRALRGIVIDVSYNEDAVRSAAVEQPNYELEAAGSLTWFVSGIERGLSSLMRKKSSALNLLQEALVFPITGCGIFGPCKEEVLAVVKFADFERRLQNLRFISSKDLLFCLSLSRVGTCVKRLLDKHKPSFSELSMFMLYRRAREEADNSGDELMTLDHLVMAFYPGKHQIGEQTSTCEGEVLHYDAWDGVLRERLGASGYERGDVKMWNAFSKPARPSKDPYDYSSSSFVSEQLTKSNYRLYDRNELD